jgi:hypothetical protein
VSLISAIPKITIRTTPWTVGASLCTESRLANRQSLVEENSKVIGKGCKNDYSHSIVAGGFEVIS